MPRDQEQIFPRHASYWPSANSRKIFLALLLHKRLPFQRGDVLTTFF